MKFFKHTDALQPPEPKKSIMDIVKKDLAASAYAAPFSVGLPYFANNLVVHYSTSNRPFSEGSTSPLDTLRRLYKRLPHNAVGAIFSKVGFLAPYFIINDIFKGTPNEAFGYGLSIFASGVVQSMVTYHVRSDQILARIFHDKPVPKEHFSTFPLIQRYSYLSKPHVLRAVYPYWLGCYSVANPATILALDGARTLLRKQYPHWSNTQVTIVGGLIALPPLQLGLVVTNTWAAKGMSKALGGTELKIGPHGPYRLILFWTIIQKVSESIIAFTVAEQQKERIGKKLAEQRQVFFSEAFREGVKAEGTMTEMQEEEVHKLLALS